MIDHDKLLALLKEARDALEPLTGKQIIKHGIAFDLADRIDNALAQPAEADKCEFCVDGWESFEGYGNVHHSKCDVCGGTGKKPAEAVEGVNWPAERIKLILHEAITAGARHETQLALIGTAIRNAVLQTAEAAQDAAWTPERAQRLADGCLQLAGDVEASKHDDAAQGAVAWVYGVSSPSNGGRPYIAPKDSHVKFYIEDQFADAVKRHEYLTALVETLNRTHPQAAPAQGDGVQATDGLGGTYSIEYVGPHTIQLTPVAASPSPESGK